MRHSLFVAALAAFVFLGCTLNPNALYKCETDSGCVQEGYACWSDGYCHPPADGPEDGGGGGGTGGGGAGGGMGGGGGPCVPATACPVGAECGAFDAGCGQLLTCGGRCPSPRECGTTLANHCGLPRVCTASGVCWEHPLPQGNSLRTGWGIDGRRAWLGGDNGTVLLWNGERTLWPPAPPLAGSDVLSVQSASLDEAFAVGTRGLVWAWDGAQWQAEGVAGGFNGTLSAVVALGGGRAVAAGVGGVVAWRDTSKPSGARWLTDTSFPGSADLSAAATVGADVFVAGGVTVSRATGPTSGWMQDIAFADGGPVLELAASGGLLYALQQRAADGGVVARVSVRASGGGWSTLAEVPFPARALRPSGDVLWLAGDDATLLALRIDGGVLGSQLAGTDSTRDFAALAPQANGEVVVAGVGGLVGFATVDGGFVEHSLAASRLTLGKLCAFPTAGEPRVAATSASPPCDGGCVARLLERRETTRGTEWQVADVAQSTGLDTLACHLESATLGWATTPSRTVLYRGSSTTWAAADFGVGNEAHWTGVWGGRGGPWYFVGDHPLSLVMRNFDGGVGPTNFLPDDIGMNTRLRAVAGVSRDNSFAVGLGGAVAKLQPNFTFNSVMGPNAADMTAVAATSFPDGGGWYLAVGLGGAVWGAQAAAANLTPLSGFPSADYRDVWVAPTGDAVLVGDAGVGVTPAVVWWQRADGGMSTRSVPTDVALTGVYGWPLGDAGVHRVWLTGEHGTVLTFTR